MNQTRNRKDTLSRVEEINELAGKKKMHVKANRGYWFFGLIGLFTISLLYFSQLKMVQQESIRGLSERVRSDIHCIEFQHIYKAYSGYDEAADSEMIQDLCPLSMEKTGCSDSNEEIGKMVLQEKSRLRKEDVAWSNVVIMILIMESEKTDALIQAHFDTWLKHAGEGLDVVLVTDVDDGRLKEEIFPNEMEVKPKVHLYRSATMKEGKHARYKVLDGLRYTMELFEDRKDKKYFFKMDPDAVLNSRNLLLFLSKLNMVVEDLLPVYFGFAMCHDQVTKICHGAGAIYGMNRIALHAVNTYVKEHVGFFESLEETETLMHEDFMIAYVVKHATGMPVINCGSFYSESPWKYYAQSKRNNKLWVTWPLSNTPISFHHIRDPKEHRLFECYFYDKDNVHRDIMPYEHVFRKRNLCAA